MAKIIGRLLLFDTPLNDGSIISHDCKIDIPDKVPIGLRVIPSNSSDMIGLATVTRDDEGLIFESDFHLEYSSFGISDIHDMLPGCGGFYNCVKRGDTGKIVEMKLRSIMLTPASIHKDFTWEIKTEEFKED